MASRSHLRPPASHAPVRVLTEEWLNSLTHGLGLVLSVPGLVVLVTVAAMHGHPGYFWSCWIFGSALVLMYAASFLYHSFRAPSLRRILRIVDHVAIYLLIAGTYTPFLLVSIGGRRGIALLFVIWGIALAGAVFKIFFTGRFTRFSTGLYLAMGWLVVVAVKPLLASVPLQGVLWLVAGGLCYTGGVVFFAWERLPYNHAIWHLFVLGGSLCHYMAVLFYAL